MSEKNQARAIWIIGAFALLCRVGIIALAATERLPDQVLQVLGTLAGTAAGAVAAYLAGGSRVK